MAVTESADTVGLRPLHDFDEAWATWPRGDRLDALRSAAYEFRARFRADAQVTGVRTFELAAVPYPAKFAFGMAARFAGVSMMEGATALTRMPSFATSSASAAVSAATPAVLAV